MSVLRQKACEALLNYLQPLVDGNMPPLSSSISYQVAWADYADDIAYPGVVVVPGKFSFYPTQEQEEDDTVSGSLLVSAGELDGTVQIRAYAATQFVRRSLEDAIIQALCSSELSPGVVSLRMDPVPIGGVTWVSGSICSFQVDDVEWNEERVFSSRRYSYLDLDCQYPMLYARQSYDIQNLQFVFSAAVTEDLSTSAFVSGSDGPYETKTVTASGSSSYIT